jgi:formate--tetrahydrofolate ligase 1
MLSDIEIAQKNRMLPIADIAQRIDIDADGIEPFGQYKAKLIAETLRALRKRALDASAHLILVTAVTPTSTGEGKSTVSIGLADALNRIEKKRCLRSESRL